MIYIIFILIILLINYELSSSEIYFGNKIELPPKRKIIDTFMFHNEYKMLLFRLTELYDYVDYFILAEASFTFAGKPKVLYFNDKFKNELLNNNNYTKFLDKIVHVRIDDMPIDYKDAWDLEDYNRRALDRGIQELSKLNLINNNDFLLHCDVDEIPNTKVLKQIKYFTPSSSVMMTEIYCLEMDWYYYNLHWFINRNWNLPKIIPYSYYQNYYGIKNNNNTIIDFVLIRLANEEIPCLKDGGWHFSYFMSANEISTKIKSMAHQDLNTKDNTNEIIIQRRIDRGEDLYGRERYKNFNYIKIENNPFLPVNYKMLL